MTGHANNYETAKRKFPSGHPWRKPIFSEVDRIKMAKAREKGESEKPAKEKR